MHTENRDLMCQAREALAGRWGIAIRGTVIYMIIQIILSIIPRVGPVAVLVLTGPLVMGYCAYYLSIARKEEAEYVQLFSGFSAFVSSLAAYLLMILFILLWSLLLIVPGVIAALAYSQAFYILVDNPGLGGLEALRRSKEMMRENKWKLFCLTWRFFGWALLCALTLGIGFLWLGPYMAVSYSRFYDDIRSTTAENPREPRP
ncbi:MAG: DUF975 family protein [Candidatus Aureabacteria bacterium]|nr:DUF975 family protein [Candidatus Auribacterota bacterium]